MCAVLTYDMDKNFLYVLSDLFKFFLINFLEEERYQPLQSQVAKTFYFFDGVFTIFFYNKSDPCHLNIIKLCYWSILIVFQV